MVIRTPSAEEMKDEKPVTLVCLVTGFSPRDVYVMWSVDDGTPEEGVTSEPVGSDDDGTFSVTGLFRVNRATWDASSRVTCAVKHVSKDNRLVTYAKAVSKAIGNAIECDN